MVYANFPFLPGGDREGLRGAHRKIVGHREPVPGPDAKQMTNTARTHA